MLICIGEGAFHSNLACQRGPSCLCDLQVLREMKTSQITRKKHKSTTDSLRRIRMVISDIASATVYGANYSFDSGLCLIDPLMNISNDFDQAI